MSSPVPYLYGITVPTRALRAIRLFASIDQTRYIINSLFFEITPGVEKAEVTIVATDGRRLACWRDELDFRGDTSQPRTLLVAIPAAQLKGEKLFIDVLAGGLFVELRTADTTNVLRIRATDGLYPDWRKCIPADTTPRPIVWSFNASYLEDFIAAAQLLGGKKSYGVMLYGFQTQAQVDAGSPDGNCYGVHINGDRRFFGLLMPVRNDDGEGVVPFWIKRSEAPFAPQPAPPAPVSSAVESVTVSQCVTPAPQPAPAEPAPTAVESAAQPEPATP